MDTHIKLNIFSPLTKEQEDIVKAKMETSIRCPLCACGRTAKRKLNEMLRETRTHDEIWRTFNSLGYTPKLNRNTIDCFGAAVDRHVLMCLREDVTDYKRALRDRKVNEKLAEELSIQAKTLGIDAPSIFQEDSHINNGTPEVVTMSRFKKESGELFPAIFLNTLKQIKFDQERYLRGEIDTPPDLKEIDSIIRSLTKLIGSAEIADILRET